jgi:hypothetical protein
MIDLSPFSRDTKCTCIRDIFVVIIGVARKMILKYEKKCCLFIYYRPFNQKVRRKVKSACYLYSIT